MNSNEEITMRCLLGHGCSPHNIIVRLLYTIILNENILILK